MPEITVKKSTIYLNKVFQDWDKPCNHFYLSKKWVLVSYDKERAATGEVRRHAPPETPFLVFLACVAGVWKKWAQERMDVSACLPLGRPFFFAPTTSKSYRAHCACPQI